MVLKNFSLKLLAKKHYALAGANGAGKSTVIKLPTGLYGDCTGDILIDGKNLRDFSQAELKGLFSTVYQDFARYQISTRECIGLGGAGASEAEIAAAAETFGLGGTVSKLPDGLDTPLGKLKRGGSRPVGGRMAARGAHAFACEPRAAEWGTHDGLMARGGLYAEMFEAQRGWYA